MIPMEVRGEGVVLRPWRIEDVPAVTAACQDARDRTLARFRAPALHGGGCSLLRPGLHRRAEDRKPFAITDAETGEVIGSIDMRINRMQTGHIGYWLAAEARGRGLTTAALRALSRWAIEELGLGRVELVTDPDNIASQRVAEKAGFKREGILRSILVNRDGSRRDGVMFSLLPDELD